MGNQISCPHKEYLGRGVDCRTPNGTWFNALDICSCGRPITQDKIRVKETSFVTTHEEAVDHTDQSIKGVEFELIIKPHECASLFGELIINRYTHTTTRHRDTLKITKIVEIISIECKKYELHLYEFIVKYIEEKREEQIDLGKQLTYRDPKDRFEEYLSGAKKSEDASSLLQMWQTVADACSSFLDETKCTHYVSCIKLGAKQHESTDSKKYDTNIACGAGGNACQGASCSSQAQCQTGSERNVSTKDERGVIDRSSGAVTTEEVIEATLMPLFKLIDSNELRVIMRALLRCHHHGSTGMQVTI
jgi:hypothetical protein